MKKRMIRAMATRVWLGIMAILIGVIVGVLSYGLIFLAMKTQAPVLLLFVGLVSIGLLAAVLGSAVGRLIDKYF